MIQMISATSFTTSSGSKTFNLDQHSAGHWCVTSFATADPTARVFWGCKTFRSLLEVESHYKAFRGLTAMVSVLTVAA